MVLVGQAIFALKLFFDVYAISVYQKRYVSAPVKNIGSWNQIFEALTFMGTAANAAFVWFTCDGLRKLFGEPVGLADENDANQRDLLIIIAAEHLLFILKVVIARNVPTKSATLEKRMETRKFNHENFKIKKEMKNEIKFE